MWFQYFLLMIRILYFNDELFLLSTKSISRRNVKCRSIRQSSAPAILIANAMCNERKRLMIAHIQDWEGESCYRVVNQSSNRMKRWRQRDDPKGFQLLSIVYLFVCLLAELKQEELEDESLRWTSNLLWVNNNNNNSSMWWWRPRKSKIKEEEVETRWRPWTRTCPIFFFLLLPLNWV